MAKKERTPKTIASITNTNHSKTKLRALINYGVVYSYGIQQIKEGAWSEEGYKY